MHVAGFDGWSADLRRCIINLLAKPVTPFTARYVNDALPSPRNVQAVPLFLASGELCSARTEVETSISCRNLRVISDETRRM